MWTDAHTVQCPCETRSQFCRNAFRAESKGEQEEKSQEYTTEKIF
jgi:hypothetical protein